MQKNKSFYLQRIILLILLNLIGTGFSFSATHTWDGGGADDNWSTDANWVGDAATDPAPGDTIIFDSNSVARQTTGVCDVDLSGGTGIIIQIANNVPANIEFTVGSNIELATGTSIDMTAAAFNLTIKTGAGTITLEGAATFDVVTSKSLSITEDLNNSGNNITVQGAGNTTVSGVVSGAGQVIKNGAGILTLSAATNTFSGNLTINAGTVSLNNATAPLAAGVISMSGGVLLLNQGINAANWNRSITLTGGATIQTAAASVIDTNITNGGNLLTLTGTENLTISGIIGSGAGGITVNMTALADVVTLSGGNTYTGATSVSAGTLNIQNNTGTGSTAGGVSVTAGASLQLQGGITVGNEALTLNGNGGASELENVSGTNSWSGNIALATAASDIKSSAGTLTLSGTISGQNITFDCNTGNITATGVIGAGGITVTQSGTGTLTLNGDNTYTGVLSIGTNGNVILGHANAFGTGGGILSIAAGGTLGIGTAINATDWDQTITLAGAATINSDVAGSEIDTNITNGGNLLTITGDENLLISGVLGAGAGGLTVNMTSIFDVVTLTGANTFSGATNVTAGTLNIQNSTGTGTTAGGVSVSAGASLQLQGGITVGNETLTLNGGGSTELENVSGTNAWGGAVTLATTSIDIKSTAGTLTLGSTVIGQNVIFDCNSGNIVVTGAVGAGGGQTLTKSGTGILTLNGANNYSAGTTVNAGTLNLNGTSTNVGAVICNNAGTVLAGSGTIPGAVTMNTGTILAPGGTNGDAAGTMTINGLLTFNGESKYRVTITGGSADKITAANNIVATGSTPNVEIQAGYSVAGLTIPATIMDITGTYTAFDESGLPAGWDIDNTKVGNLIRIVNVAASLSYDASTFTEHSNNDGSIATTLNLTLTNDTFVISGAAMTLNTHYTVSNVPSGLTVVLTGTSTTTATLTLSGNAASHDNINDISNLTITFLNASFSGGSANSVTNYSKTDISIDFADTPASPSVPIPPTVGTGGTVKDGESIENTSNLNNVTVASGGTLINTGILTDLINNGAVIGGTISGSPTNQGSLVNLTLSESTILDNASGRLSGVTNNGTVYGGTFDDTITNTGLLAGTAPEGYAGTNDYTITINTGSMISGGQIEGQITSKGTLKNITINSTGIILGGSLSGTNTNKGELNGVNIGVGSTLINTGTVIGGTNNGMIQGGKIKGVLSDGGNELFTNQGELNNVTIIQNTSISFEIPFLSLPAKLTGKITLIIDDNMTCIINIPASTTFPDMQSMGYGEKFLMIPKNLITYANENGWTSTMESAGVVTPKSVDNATFKDIPSTFILVDGLILSEKGIKSSAPTTYTIPYNATSIPDGFSDENISILVFDIDLGEWLSVIIDEKNDDSITFSTEMISAYAIAVSVSPVITVSPISGNTTESGETATFTVVLGEKPSADVSIDISSSDETEATVSPTNLTFTVDDWYSLQSVTVTGVDDILADGNQNLKIILAPAISSDSSYNGINPSDVPVVNVDNETVEISVEPMTGETSEDGKSFVFSIVLSSQPEGDVNISLSSSDETEGTLSTLNVVFTPDDWDIYQLVTVTGVNDDLEDGNKNFEILFITSSDDSNYDDLSLESIKVINVDTYESTNSNEETDNEESHKNEDNKNDGFCFIKTVFYKF